MKTSQLQKSAIQIHFHECIVNMTGNVHINETWRGIHLTTAAVERQ
jgi:DNA-binding GntR family transcriptional regulator